MDEKVILNKEGILSGLVRRFENDITYNIEGPKKVRETVEIFEIKNIEEYVEGVLLIEQEMLNEAVEKFIIVVDKVDSDPNIKPKMKAMAHYNLGVVYGYSGRYNEGIKELASACNKFEPRNTRNKCYREISKIKGFKEDAEKLKELRID